MFRKAGMIIGTKILWPGPLDEVEQSQYFLFFVYPTPEPTESLCIIKIAIIIDRPGLTSTTSVSVLLVCGVEVNIVAENVRIKHHLFHVVGSRRKKVKSLRRVAHSRDSAPADNAISFAEILRRC